MEIEVRIVLSFGREGLGRKHKGVCQNDGNILYFDMGGGYV